MKQKGAPETQPIKEDVQIDVAPALDIILQNTDGTPESIKSYFETLSFDEFGAFLNSLNGYFRGSLDNQGMDGNGVTGDGYLPPDSEYRIQLLKEAFEKAMKEDSQAKSAIILGMTILTTHSYSDGNGRTSRTIFTLLTNGYTGSRHDRKLFNVIGQPDEIEDEIHFHKSGSSIIDLDPSNMPVENRLTLSELIYGNMMSSAVERRLGFDAADYPIRVGLGGQDKEFNMNSQLNVLQQEKLSEIFGSNPLAFVACINSFSDNLYKASLKNISFDGKKYKIISYGNIIELITPEEFSRLEQEYNRVGVAYIRKTMDVVERDDFQDIYQRQVDKIEAWKAESQD